MTIIGAKQANYHPLIRISLLRFFYRLNKLDAFYEKNRDAPAFVSELNKVLFPTLGRPTIPAVKLINITSFYQTIITNIKNKINNNNQKNKHLSMRP